MLAKIKAVWRIILETIFPKMCLGCGMEGDFLCDDCLKSIPRQQEQVCPICYVASPVGAVCKFCESQAAGQKSNFFLDGLIVASEFNEKSLLQHVIHVFKYEFIQLLADPLGKLLIETVKKYDFANTVICPVPLHKVRYKWRGFNQAELLAERIMVGAGRETAVSGMTGADGATAGGSFKMQNLLERKTFSKPQMELKRGERLKNVANAFGIVPGRMPAEVLLVDDVATTTATLNACAKVLKQAGVKKVFAIVLARVY